jgi:hypothetical protein
LSNVKPAAGYWLLVTGCWLTSKFRNPQSKIPNHLNLSSVICDPIRHLTSVIQPLNPVNRGWQAIRLDELQALIYTSNLPQEFPSNSRYQKKEAMGKTQKSGDRKEKK